MLMAQGETDTRHQDDADTPRSDDHDRARLAVAYIEAGASVRLARALAGLGR
jgi:hypothetical protein